MQLLFIFPGSAFVDINAWPTYSHPKPHIYIDINSTPPGAQICIDGVNSGELTPYRKYFDRSGEHTIELILNGYQPYQENFYISESMTKKETLIPIVLPQSHIYIDINSTPSGDISKSMTKTPTMTLDSTQTRFPISGLLFWSPLIAIFFVYFFIFKDKR